MKTVKVFVFCITLLETACSMASVIGVPGDASTLADAVRRAADGDAIRLSTGNYRESIVIDKNLTIEGSGYEACIIEAPEDDAESVVVTVRGSLALSGLTVRGGSTAVMVKSGASLSLDNCRIADADEDGIGFESDFNTTLFMTGCLVTGNTDGIDLEGTQGYVLDSRFIGNRDDGLDYDGDAGVLVSGCQFRDNNDDGIEIRIATRTHAIILDSVFSGNGEDGIEIINSPVENGIYNILSVQNCRFESNRRFGVGFVAHTVEEHTGEMSKTAVYAVGNHFNGNGESGVSPNYRPVFVAPDRYPARAAYRIERPNGAVTGNVDVRIPLLVGVYNLRPTVDGFMAQDGEGITVLGDRVYVADDNAHAVHVLDRRTGIEVAGIPTTPLPGGKHEAKGPEGLDTGNDDGIRLYLSDDDAPALFALSLRDDSYGEVLAHRSLASLGVVEGIERISDTVTYYATDHDHIVRTTAFSTYTVPVGLPESFRISIEGFGGHIAGVGADDDGRRIYCTLSGYAQNNANRRNHLGGFFTTDSDITRIDGMWHLGPFSNDPRGVAVDNGLVYVIDGKSDFVDEETGERTTWAA